MFESRGLERVDGGIFEPQQSLCAAAIVPLNLKRRQEKAVPRLIMIKVRDRLAAVSPPRARHSPAWLGCTSRTPPVDAGAGRPPSLTVFLTACLWPASSFAARSLPPAETAEAAALGPRSQPRGRSRGACISQPSETRDAPLSRKPDARRAPLVETESCSRVHSAPKHRHTHTHKLTRSCCREGTKAVRAAAAWRQSLYSRLHSCPSPEGTEQQKPRGRPRRPRSPLRTGAQTPRDAGKAAAVSCCWRPPAAAAAPWSRGQKEKKLTESRKLGLSRPPPRGPPRRGAPAAS